MSCFSTGLMLHDLVPQQLTFILPHYHHPFHRNQCQHVQTRPTGLTIYPSRRMSSSFTGDTSATQLRFSRFASHEGDDATPLHHQSRRWCSEYRVLETRMVQASIKNSRDSKPVGRKLFIIDSRWIIGQAHREAAIDPSTTAQTQILRRCASALAKFLNTYTYKHPVIVVVPNHNELTQLITQSTDRKLSSASETKWTPSIHFIPALKKICRALGVAIYSGTTTRQIRDVVGGLVGKRCEFGIPLVIVSADSDFLQLLERGLVTIMEPGTGTKFEHISEQFFTDTMYGLHPRQYVDLLVLTGKKGKPKGVPHIKQQLAMLLASQFGDIEGIIAAAKTIVNEGNTYTRRRADLLVSEVSVLLSFRTAKRLLRQERDLLQAKRRTSIRRNRYCSVRLSELDRQPSRRSEVVRVLQRFEDLHKKEASRQQHKMTYRYREEERVSAQSESKSRKAVAAADERNFRLPTFKDEGSVSTAEVRNSDSIAADASGSDADLDEILSSIGSSLALVPVFERDETGRKLKGIAVGGQQGKAIFVDIRSNGHVPISLVDLLQSKFVEKCGCFLRELYKLLLTEYDITMNGTIFDAHIALDLLNAEEKEIHDLVSVTTGFEKNLAYELLSTRIRFVPEYSVDHSVSLCCLLTQLISSLRQELQQEGLWTLALRVEFPLIRVLGSMEIRGVPVDREELDNLRTMYRERLSKIESKIGDLLTAYGASQSRNRGIALSKVLKNCLAQHDKANTAYKVVVKPTVSRSEFEMMASNDNLPNDCRALASLFVEHEDLSKFIDRDIAPLSRHLQSDSRVRTTFEQGSSATGRLTTRNPNLQSVPVRSQLGRELRNAFRAEDGMYLLCADYSQIELRIVASLCGDPFMLDAFSSGVDIHRCIAGKIFDIPTTDVTNIQRKQAKQVIYSILYGVSSVGLSERLAVPVRAAENLLSEFKIEFPSVQALANQLIKEATKRGYAKTLLGRRLPLPMLVRGDSSERRAASRKAINMPIQGTQADMIKLSMVRIHERLRANRAQSALVLQVHDELILEVADRELEEVVSLVEEEMTSALPLTGVDVAVKIRYGPSWSSRVQPFSGG